MDFENLQIFVEVAEAGGFNRASANLHLAQSAISRRITRLEYEIGMPLFERSPRGTSLTPAGVLLLERSQGLLRHFAQVQSDIFAEANEPRGEINIGFPPSLNSLTTRLLGMVGERFPLLLVRSWVATSVELRDMLLAGKLDLAVYADEDQHSLVATRSLFEEDLVLFGPDAEALQRGSVWKHLHSLPLLLTSRPNSVRLLVEAAAAERRCRLKVTMDVNDVPLLIELVRSGAGYTILPASALNAVAGEGLLAASVPGLRLHWVVGHPAGQPLSFAGQRTLELICDVYSAS